MGVTLSFAIGCGLMVLERRPRRPRHEGNISGVMVGSACSRSIHTVYTVYYGVLGQWFKSDKSGQEKDRVSHVHAGHWCTVLGGVHSVLTKVSQTYRQPRMV